MKYKTIYSLWVKLELAKRGFEPLDERQNPDNRKLSCWDYAITDDFKQALDYILSKHKTA